MGIITKEMFINSIFKVKGRSEMLLVTIPMKEHGKIINHMDSVFSKLSINLNTKETLLMESGMVKENLLYKISLTNFLLMELFLKEIFKALLKYLHKMANLFMMDFLRTENSMGQGNGTVKTGNLMKVKII